MGLKAIARMIQTMLYAKRFFPYYVYNILGGIEEDGELLIFCSEMVYRTDTNRNRRRVLLRPRWQL